jgi:hypothetical protein
VRLIHPVTIRVAPLDVDGSQVDGLARERAVRRSYLDEVELEAQLDYTDQNRRGIGMAGADMVHVATAVVRRCDVDALNWTPRRGDRVTMIRDCAGRDDNSNLYVDRATPLGYWRGGSSIITLDLTDEAPTRDA